VTEVQQSLRRDPMSKLISNQTPILSNISKASELDLPRSTLATKEHPFVDLRLERFVSRSQTASYLSSPIFVNGKTWKLQAECANYAMWLRFTVIVNHPLRET